MLKKFKDWTGWTEAGSIVIARLETLVGLIGAGITSVLAFDWMTLFTPGGTQVNWTYLATISGYFFIKGIATEITRRYNDPYLAMQTAAEEKHEAVKELPKLKKKVLKEVKKS